MLARTDEVFPRVCAHCSGAMRLIAFIADGPTLGDILVHLGAPIAPPTVAPARGPPLWEMPPAGQREIDPFDADAINRVLRGTTSGLDMFQAQVTVLAHRGEALARRLPGGSLLLDLVLPAAPA